MTTTERKREPFVRRELPKHFTQRTGANALWHNRRQSMRGPEADAGQAMIFALIVVLVASLVPTFMISNLNRQIPVVTSAANFDAALAAAQAGIQSYRNLLDAYPAYWQYNASSTIPAGEGGPNPAFTGWETVPHSSPTESFTYYPDTTQLRAATGGQLSGDVLLTVIGRAGTAGRQTAYRRVQAALSLSGVLTDVYYSNYEQPGTLDSDQWDQNVYKTGDGNPCTPTGPCSAQAYDEITANLSYAPLGQVSPAPSVPTITESAATALCLYDASQQNQFIDWYSQYVAPISPPSNSYPGFSSRTPYNTGVNLPNGVAANPYYGPWYGTFTDPLNPRFQFGNGAGSLSACNVNYWITGDSFNGPVYSQDELTTCGRPAFAGTPSLQTAVSNLFNFPANWPGTKPPSGGFSHPYGYVRDPFGVCGGPDTPTFTDPSSPRFAVNQSLPPLANELKTQIEQGTIAGCVYTGPTAIRFYWNPSTQAEQMVVWSPLTQVTFASRGANCGTWATTQPESAPGSPQVTGAAPGTVQTKQSLLQVVPVTQPLVIYVQNTPTWNNALGGYQNQDPNAWQTLPNAEASATVAGCIDPFVNSGPTASVNATTCNEGDTMLSGTLGHGSQITVDSESSNVISHSLVYDCGLSGGGNWPTYTNSLAGCGNSLDVLGLVANNNTWLAHPVSAGGGQLASCTDDYDMPAPGDTFGTTPPTPSVPPRAAGDTFAGEVDFNDMIPTLCDQRTPILDAATASLQGFFEVQNWREGDAGGGTLYFNGSTAVNNAGQYGVFQAPATLVSGYLLNLTYDLRLRYLVPPSFIQATASVWAVVNWTSCGNSSYATPGTAGVKACTPLPT